MRGGIVPPALLFLALGLALAFTPRHALVPSLLALLVTLVASALVRVPQTWLEGVFFCLLDKCDRNGGECASRPQT